MAAGVGGQATNSGNGEGFIVALVEIIFAALPDAAAIALRRILQDGKNVGWQVDGGCSAYIRFLASADDAAILIINFVGGELTQFSWHHAGINHDERYGSITAAGFVGLPQRFLLVLRERFTLFFVFIRHDDKRRQIF